MSTSWNAGRKTMSERMSTAIGQVLVEDFDVVARVFLRGERVELPAD